MNQQEQSEDTQLDEVFIPVKSNRFTYDRYEDFAMAEAIAVACESIGTPPELAHIVANHEVHSTGDMGENLPRSVWETAKHMRGFSRRMFFFEFQNYVQRLELTPSTSLEDIQRKLKIREACRNAENQQGGGFA